MANTVLLMACLVSKRFVDAIFTVPYKIFTRKSGSIGESLLIQLLHVISTVLNSFEFSMKQTAASSCEKDVS